MLQFLLFYLYNIPQTVNCFVDLSDIEVAPLDDDGHKLHLRPLVAEPGKFKITFGQLVNEFKNIEDTRQSALKQILRSPQVTNNNKTSKFLEVATELDIAFMRIRIYCDAARVVFEAINFTQPDDNFLRAAAVMKKEKKLDDQIADLSDLFERMEESLTDLTEEQCDPFQSFILCVSYTQMKLEQLAVQYAEDYQKTIKIAKDNTQT
ncbi:unnamed protein product [Bemisia tabaci]|uniref:Uncharacterized protein n=2 Tax=Bemisia tabaci TaxID=7038 RepID=A0A9P0A9A4_BEMTA|nr:unnamed protein product [Bemisia tabaci]